MFRGTDLHSIFQSSRNGSCRIGSGNEENLQGATHDKQEINHEKQ